MAEGPTAGRVATVAFPATRSELFGLLFRGHLLMLPTIGIYRFWMVTWKRRFYWHHTIIDGDALEYTGRATQLLVGFLIAIGFFLPIYGVFFYLSTQTPQIAVAGYGVVAVVLWFLTGYAIYRARDFRLSRTLWRGIRFDQRGNAWGYALRRFGWSILMVVTLGLVYPAMAGNLWRYRWRHTWYGDRQFSFSGSWRQVAGPYYKVYFGMLALTVAWLGYGGATKGFSGDAISPELILLAVLELVVGGLAYFYFRSRETTRMFSTISIGNAGVRVHVRARGLLGQFLIYALALAGSAFALLVVLAILAGSVFTTGVVDGKFDLAMLASMFQSSWITVAAIILVYLGLLASFTILGEVFLGFGFWALVARGATLTNPDSLRTVRAAGEDRAIAGEGLADALNVGAY